MFLGVYSSACLAAPKELICISSADDEANRLTEVAANYADPEYIMYDLDSSAIFKDLASKCIGASYGWRHSYVFDTDGLQDSTKNKAEFQRMSCSGRVNPVVEVTFSATPTVITFTSSDHPKRFNVNRSDLRAGIDTERDFSCELNDIDLSGNML